MYSLPTRTTLAALTIASAASIAPTSPLVSTIPSASMVILFGLPRARRRLYQTGVRGDEERLSSSAHRSPPGTLVAPRSGAAGVGRSPGGRGAAFVFSAPQSPRHSGRTA